MARGGAISGLLFAMIFYHAAAQPLSLADRGFHGFRVGMGESDVLRIARETCGVSALSDLREGVDSRYPGGDYGLVYACGLDDAKLRFSLTPTTRRLYALKYEASSQADCDEFLAFAQRTFNLSGGFVVVAGRSDPGAACPGWEWRPSASFSVAIRRFEVAGRYRVVVEDADVVGADLSAAEAARRRRTTIVPKLF